MRTLLFLPLLLACQSGLVVDNSDGMASQDLGPDMAKPAVPKYHRPAADPCPTNPPAGFCGHSSPQQDCYVDSDCTAGVNGRCNSKYGGCACTYQECVSDADCGGMVCTCRGEGGTRLPANKCLPGACHIDADCGPGSYCSPSADPMCANTVGLVGWYCHSRALDPCLDTSECPTNDQKMQQTCTYKPSFGHFACLDTFCF